MLDVKAVRRPMNDSPTTGCVVRRDHHAVGEGDAVRDLPRLAVGSDQRDRAGCPAAR